MIDLEELILMNTIMLPISNTQVGEYLFNKNIIYTGQMDGDVTTYKINSRWFVGKIDRTKSESRGPGYDILVLINEVDDYVYAGARHNIEEEFSTAEPDLTPIML